MSIKLVDDTKITAIGTSIRTTGGTQALLTLDEMPAAIEALGGGGGGGFDFSQVTGGVKFTNGVGQTSLDFTGADFSNVTKMEEMFQWCSALTSVDMSGLDTSSVTTMARMFQYCSGITSIDLSGVDTTAVTEMTQMFYSCSSLTYLDLYSFDTPRLTRTTSMFYNVWRMLSLNLSSIDTTNATAMYGMFDSCNSNLEIIWSQKPTVQPICHAPSDMNITSGMKFYVPDNLLNDYKQATNWSMIENQIYSINDLPSSLATLYAGHY